VFTRSNKSYRRVNVCVCCCCCFSVALRPNAGHGLLILEVFLDHTQRRTTVGKTPLDEWSARRRDLYLTTHNTYKRQIPMLPVRFEPTFSAGKRPQTYALDRAATANGECNYEAHKIKWSTPSIAHFKYGQRYTCTPTSIFPWYVAGWPLHLTYKIKGDLELNWDLWKTFMCWLE
jgi:hypothetical protein